MILMLISVLIWNNLKRLAFVNKEKYTVVRKRILFDSVSLLAINLSTLQT